MSGPKRPASNSCGSPCQCKFGKLWPIQVTFPDENRNNIFLQFCSTLFLFQQRQAEGGSSPSVSACSHVADPGLKQWWLLMHYEEVDFFSNFDPNQEPAPPQYTPSAQQTVTNADFQVNYCLSFLNLLTACLFFTFNRLLCETILKAIMYLANWCSISCCVLHKRLIQTLGTYDMSRCVWCFSNCKDSKYQY